MRNFKLESTNFTLIRSKNVQNSAPPFPLPAKVGYCPVKVDDTLTVVQVITNLQGLSLSIFCMDKCLSPKHWKRTTCNITLPKLYAIQFKMLPWILWSTNYFTSIFLLQSNVEKLQLRGMAAYIKCYMKDKIFISKVSGTLWNSVLIDQDTISQSYPKLQWM